MASSDPAVISDRALGRALLARQGLLERRAADLPAAVEAVGALQSQRWTAPPVALFARVADFRPEQLAGVLAHGHLVTGTLLRGTLHIVSAAEHPAYAATLEGSGSPDWRRTKETPTPTSDRLRPWLAEQLPNRPHTPAEAAELCEEWVAKHPGSLGSAELAAQRASRWRPVTTWTGLVRVPADGA